MPTTRDRPRTSEKEAANRTTRWSKEGVEESGIRVQRLADRRHPATLRGFHGRITFRTNGGDKCGYTVGAGRVLAARGWSHANELIEPRS